MRFPPTSPQRRHWRTFRLHELAHFSVALDKWSTDVRATLCYDLAPELAARRAARPLAVRPRDAQLLHVGKRAQRPTDSALIAGSARAPRVGPSYLDVTASELEGLPLRVNERTEGVALDSNEQSPMAR
jgi:hypothetical protein